ncbi:MAG: tetratricopeptide repeat protein [Desulfoprunum sp.]|nr:tetratricopeptide repeat protein [Desulfoprunum sp.]
MSNTKNIVVWFLWVFVAMVLVLPVAYIGFIEVSARRGFPEAQSELGRWHDQGIWLHTSNQEEAATWYSKAAENDYAEAQYNLGLLLSEQRDYQRAVYWYLRAAIKDFSPAQNNLAVMYAKGLGVSKNLRMANHWYEKAAQNGHEKAQYSLGIAYAEGEGIAIDHSKAAYWIYQSANRNFAPAQGYLAILYVQGLGVEKNLNEALNWANKANANGDKHAAELIRLIEQLKTKKEL